MKRMLRILPAAMLAAAVLFPVLSGCTGKTADEFQAVEPVGQVPDELKQVVEDNDFHDIAAFDGRLLKAETLSADETSHTVGWQVRMMDLYGNELAAYPCASDDAYHITTLTATEDGGFLFVLGFRDRAIGEDTWAGDSGFASRVIKCDKNGTPQFDTPLDGVEGEALTYCFEKDGRFYLFGTLQTPETKTRGVYSPTDVYAVILDQNGTVIQSRSLGGSDFDSLESAEMLADRFVLSIRSQSDDGDFSGSDANGYPVDWVVTLGDDLAITETKKEAGRDYSDIRLGEVDGAPVYRSSALLRGFDAGTPTAVIDYGDFTLIVSENITGEYEKTPPYISSAWYYTETVYSAYDRNGGLLFRASADSSPDYDAMAEG